MFGITFKLPAAETAQVDDLAKRELISRSDLLRRFVLAGLRRADGEGNGATMATVADLASPWMTIDEGTTYVCGRNGHCGKKLLYHEIRAGRLRAARIGGRRDYRLRREWLDE